MGAVSARFCTLGAFSGLVLDSHLYNTLPTYIMHRASMAVALLHSVTASRVDVDTFTFLDNGIVRVGLDTSKGASIGWFGASGGSSDNLINIHDHGREAQGSFYSGPANYNVNGSCDAPGYNPFPWNPIGAGDFYGHATQIVNVTLLSPTQAVVLSRPLLWPCNAVLCECLFEKTVTLNGAAAEVTLTLRNARSDMTVYNAFNQELPAVFTVGTLCQQYGYVGTQPFVEPVTQLPLQPFTGETHPLYMIEHWLAYIGADGYGVGVFHPTLVNFGTMYYAPATPCTGGPYNDTTGYIAPWTLEMLDWNIEYTYNFSLIYGDVQTIRAYAQARMAGVPPSPQYVFAKDRQHFWYTNAQDVWPVLGALNVSMPIVDPQVIGPLDYWPAADVPIIYITASYAPSQHDNQAQLFWQRNDTSGFTADNVVNFDVTLDGAWHTYAVNVGGEAGYNGTITRLRLDPVVSGQPGAYVLIACISREPQCATA